jgi:hypothetical protein
MTNNKRASLETLNINTTPMHPDLWRNIASDTNIVETCHVSANDGGIKNSLACAIML